MVYPTIPVPLFNRFQTGDTVPFKRGYVVHFQHLSMFVEPLVGEDLELEVQEIVRVRELCLAGFRQLQLIQILKVEQSDRQEKRSILVQGNTCIFT
jgi:hypothetical protein